MVLKNYPSINGRDYTSFEIAYSKRYIRFENIFVG